MNVGSLAILAALASAGLDATAMHHDWATRNAMAVTSVAVLEGGSVQGYVPGRSSPHSPAAAGSSYEAIAALSPGAGTTQVVFIAAPRSEPAAGSNSSPLAGARAARPEAAAEAADSAAPVMLKGEALAAMLAGIGVVGFIGARRRER